MNPLLRFINKFPLCDKTCRRYVISLLWLFLALLPFHEYYRNRFDLTQWDLLLFTGVAAFILGLHLVASVQGRFDRTLGRLLARGSLKIDDEEKTQFLGRLEQHAQSWARIGGIISAIAMLGAFTVALTQDYQWRPRSTSYSDS